MCQELAGGLRKVETKVCGFRRENHLQHIRRRNERNSKWRVVKSQKSCGSDGEQIERKWKQQGNIESVVSGKVWRIDCMEKQANRGDIQIWKRDKCSEVGEPTVEGEHRRKQAHCDHKQMGATSIRITYLIYVKVRINL